MPVALPQSFAFLDGVAVATIVLACSILVASLDDLYIDAVYWLRRIRRALTARRFYRPLTADALKQKPEQPIAVIVPAWHEDDVIATMLENMISTVEYGNFVVFVGTYPNDPETVAEVERAGRRFAKVRRVEVGHDGPTCKADCLNAIVAAIFAHEAATGSEFAGMVMHDSEDVLHPLELAFFNHLLPRKDLIQIPVTSLERYYTELVAGTYMDEFAEWHAKDLIVRETMSGVVPSAGVGTCFSRRAILALSADTGNQPFNTESLTEDYDIGTRLGRIGMESIFARYDVQFRISRRPWFGWGKPRLRVLTMPLCVREYFPHKFRAACRQRARWAIGISLQGWQQIGWPGPLAMNFLLYRDRKGIFTPFIAMAGYVVFAIFLAYWLFGGAWFATWRAQSTVFAEPAAQALIAVNFAILAWRLCQRMYFVGRIYGAAHAVLVVPRTVLNNVISFVAAVRAWRLFLAHLLFGRKLVWDKTAHDFPTGEKLAAERRRLGDLLRVWQAIDETELAAALDQQKRMELPLGEVLVARGLDEEVIADAVAFQSSLGRAAPTFETFSRHVWLLPPELCLRLHILSIDKRDGRLVIAAGRPLPPKDLAEVTRAAGRPPIVEIATDTEIEAGLLYVEVASRGTRTAA